MCSCRISEWAKEERSGNLCTYTCVCCWVFFACSTCVSVLGANLSVSLVLVLSPWQHCIIVDMWQRAGRECVTETKQREISEKESGAVGGCQMKWQNINRCKQSGINIDEKERWTRGKMKPNLSARTRGWNKVQLQCFQRSVCKIISCWVTCAFIRTIHTCFV